MNQSDMIFGQKEKIDIKLFFLTKSYQMIDENLFPFSMKLKIMYMIFLLLYI